MASCIEEEIHRCKFNALNPSQSCLLFRILTKGLKVVPAKLEMSREHGEKRKDSKKKKRREKGNEIESNDVDRLANKDEHTLDGDLVQEHKSREKKNGSKFGLKKKRRKENETDSADNVQLYDKDEHTMDGIDHEESAQERKSLEKKNKSKSGLKKKRRKEKGHEVDASIDDHNHTDDAMMHTGSAPESDHTKTSSGSRKSQEHKEASSEAKMKTEKAKKHMKHKKKESHISNEREIKETSLEAEEKVDEISSVDEDCSRGMKKWLLKYKESRPGLKILQENIDDFITSYEEQQEQERKEREARAAEGGWTVVVHHKGRKKTTDTESGVTVGSVAHAAVLDNMGKKKCKDVPIDFYRFQKREAQRNEVMMLRSKFEQDKKRIQELRAARKFRPY